MTKLDERPVIIKNQADGQDLELPKEHWQRANVGVAVGLAKHGHSEQLATIFAEHGFNTETVEFLIDCIVPKGPGRPKSYALELWAYRLQATKEKLLAVGDKMEKQIAADRASDAQFR